MSYWDLMLINIYDTFFLPRCFIQISTNHHSTTPKCANSASPLPITPSVSIKCRCVYVCLAKFLILLYLSVNNITEGALSFMSSTNVPSCCQLHVCTYSIFTNILHSVTSTLIYYRWRVPVES